VIYLEALVVTFAVEINVVLADRLWPRALLAVTALVGPDDLTEADRRTLAAYACVQSYKKYERIDVTFGPAQDPAASTPTAPPPSPPGDRCPPVSP
jgi:membrane protein